ncbi:hypothetical protein ACVWZZ_003092 [Bradyrhizobium sp. LM6.10]
MRRLGRMRHCCVMDMGVCMVMPMGRGMVMGVAVRLGVGRGGNHPRTLYYNITPVHAPAQGLPITIAMAAATKGNGTETAQRNQTKRAGMNGISHKITRWKANSAHATT